MRSKSSKRAAPATSGYAKRFNALLAEGWTLRNYGGGWRYFTRLLPGHEPRQAPNSSPEAPKTMQLFEACRVDLQGNVEKLPDQWIDAGLTAASDQAGKPKPGV